MNAAAIACFAGVIVDAAAVACFAGVIVNAADGGGDDVLVGVIIMES